MATDSGINIEELLAFIKDMEACADPFDELQAQARALLHRAGWTTVLEDVESQNDD